MIGTFCVRTVVESTCVQCSSEFIVVVVVK